MLPPFFVLIFNPYTKQGYCQPPCASVSDFPTVCVMFLMSVCIKLKASKLLGFVLFSTYSVSQWFCALIQTSVMFRKHWHRRRSVIFSNPFLPWFTDAQSGVNLVLLAHVSCFLVFVCVFFVSAWREESCLAGSRREEIKLSPREVKNYKFKIKV